MNIKAGIVDDHQLFLKSLAMMLESFQNYTVVVEASNGKILQEKMGKLEHGLLPDILLVDVNMPEMDGIATVQWVSEMYPAVKLVALSQNDSEKTIISMIKAGCCAYLLKDTHPNELEKALQEIHRSGFYNADVSNINFRRLLQYEQNTPKLTDKEKTFLQMACSEKTYKQIASDMYLSERTIDGYRETLFHKLNVQSRVGMVLEAIRKELVVF